MDTAPEFELGEPISSFARLESQNADDGGAADDDPGEDDAGEADVLMRVPLLPTVSPDDAEDNGSEEAESNTDSVSDSSEVPSSPWMVLSSNASFFFGSILYLTLSVKNLLHYHSSDYSDSSDSSSFDSSSSATTRFIEFLLPCFAASMYLMNAFFDVRMSALELQRHQGNAVTLQRFRGDDARWEIGVAVTFGMAAICDLIGALTQHNENEYLTYTSSSLAVHIYLLNALLLITGRRPSFSNNYPEAFMSAGDVLFVIGSLIDVGISYFESPATTNRTWRRLAAWDVTSSSLWFVDSILYILADVIPEKENDEPIDDAMQLITHDGQEEPMVQVDVNDSCELESNGIR
jgi:hypothetical protein